MASPRCLTQQGRLFAFSRFFFQRLLTRHEKRLQYLDSGVASTDYTKALDAEVENVKSDEKVRMQYMLLVEAYAQQKELGANKKVVSVIRDAIGDFSAKQLAKLLKVKEKACVATIECIEAHPDWDDEQVAEEIDWED